MSKSKKYAICPHCGEEFQIKSITKLSRNKDSTDFFDIYDQTQEEIEAALKKQNIEFGVIPKRKEE